MPVTFDFTGKVALVTGGASGIGRATAELLARSGAMVTIADMSSATGERTAAAITEAGGDATFVQANVTDEDSVTALVAAVAERSGRLDIAVNNAGIEGDIVPVAELKSDHWRRIMDTNLSGVFYCLKHEIAAMKHVGGGAIVNTASVLGLMGAYSHADYVASKHGVVGLTKAAALDHARDGIRINAVCPGLVDTPFSGEMPRPMRDRLLFSIPTGRMGAPGEIAQVIAWLCSDGASYVTGHALSVDGGVVLGGTGTRFDDLM